MATIDLATRAGDGINRVAVSANVGKGYMVGREIDLAAAVTAKGSALAALDVIEALDVPANSAILFAGARKSAVMTGTSADLTFDMGITGGDVDNFVDGWDFDAAALNSHATPLGVQEPVIVTTADTIDILFATQTGTVTGGKIWVYAFIVPLGDEASVPGIAALQS